MFTINKLEKMYICVGYVYIESVGFCVYVHTFF